MQMKRRFNFLLTALLLFAATGNVWAEATNEWDHTFIGGTPRLNYQVIQPVDDTHAGEVKVIKGTTGGGLIADYGTTDYTSIIIPETVTDGDYTYKVTEIANDAFQSATQLESITIPRSVKKIEDGSSTSPEGAFTVASSNLKTVIFNEGLETIGAYAFYGATLLASVSIPASVKEIKESAFNGTSALTSVTFASPGSQLKTIDISAFEKANITNLILPEGLDSIGAKAFAVANTNDASLRTLVIPTSVKRLNQTAANASFLNNTAKLVDVTVPARWASSASTATDNKTFAFAVSSNETLRNLAITGANTGADSIPSGAFWKYPSSASLPSTLKTLTIKEGVTEIRDTAFKYLPAGITDITFPASLVKVGANAFIKSSLENITFTKGAKQAVLEWGAFNNSDNGSSGAKPTLKTVNFNGAVATIGREAFSYTLIESIDLTGVKEVGYMAFNKSKLQGILTIPATVTKIGAAAFRADKGEVLEHVIIEGNQTAFETSAFGTTNFNKFRETLEIFGSQGENWGDGATTASGWGDAMALSDNVNAYKVFVSGDYESLYKERFTSALKAISADSTFTDLVTKASGGGWTSPGGHLYYNVDLKRVGYNPAAGLVDVNVADIIENGIIGTYNLVIKVEGVDEADKATAVQGLQENKRLYGNAYPKGLEFELIVPQLTGYKLTKWIVDGKEVVKPTVKFTLDKNSEVTIVFEDLRVPPVPVTAVKVSVDKTILSVGGTAQASAVVSPENATDPTVVWTSSKPAVATVDAATGLITAVSTGTADITATSGDIFNSLAITVFSAGAPMNIATGVDWLPTSVTEAVAADDDALRTALTGRNKANGTTLDEGTDYTVTFDFAAGKVTASITAIGTSYEGTHEFDILISDTPVTPDPDPAAFTADDLNDIITGGGSSDLTEIAVDAAIDGSTVIPSGVANKFKKLEKVTIGAGITKIEDGAFNGAANLKVLDLFDADRLTSIGKDAFKGTGLKTLYIGEHLVNIEESAFVAENIGEVYVKDKVQDIDFATRFAKTATINVSGITGVKADANFGKDQKIVGKIGTLTLTSDEVQAVDYRIAELPIHTLVLASVPTKANTSAVITEAQGNKFTTVANIKIGEGIKDIEANAFRKAADRVIVKDGRATDEKLSGQTLKSVTIGADVITIGDLAFAPSSNAYSYYKSNQPTGAREEEWVYNNLSDINSIYFESRGSSLRSVGKGAFAYAQPQEDVNISNAKSTTLDLGTGAFFHSGLQVIVADETQTAAIELILPAQSDRRIANAAFEKPSLTGTSVSELSDITGLEITTPELEEALTAYHRQKSFNSSETVATFPLALDVEPANRSDWNEDQVIRWDYFKNDNVKGFYLGGNSSRNEGLLIRKDTRFVKDNGTFDSEADYRKATLEYKEVGQLRLRAEYGEIDKNNKLADNHEVTLIAKKETGTALDILNEQDWKLNNHHLEVKVGETVNLRAVFDNVNAWQLVKWSYNPSNVILTDADAKDDRKVKVSTLPNTTSKTTVLKAETFDKVVATVEIRVVDEYSNIDAITADAAAIYYDNGLVTTGFDNVKVYTLTGQSVSGTQFAKGVYIVKASKGSDKITTKIIVK